ncbi:uncharacterized protein LOC107461281 [Arachis duranensis]|uniref:Uncharacterized protein LOC107461281 n=1 Tax=Arachis duranensis TaxID=130453 RepID=A0A6P4C1A0_ARADU|nr:uncharacterized protein LOC107461281 [Arachis duranensis]
MQRQRVLNAHEDLKNAPSWHPENSFLVTLDTHPALPRTPEYKLILPYPQRLQKASKDKKFSKFLEVFRKLQINIPFGEALEQMPKYDKFLKELFSKKRNWIEDETVRALYDLRASINLVPLSLMQKLQTDEVKPTRIFFQRAVYSIKYPLGVVEDLLVKVGPFIFPTDFVIIDMEEDKNACMILGSPFLATAKALIDVE